MCMYICLWMFGCMCMCVLCYTSIIVSHMLVIMHCRGDPEFRKGGVLTGTKCY